MTVTLAQLTTRPVLASLAGLVLLLGLATGPVLEAVEDLDRIAARREALAHARDAAARPPPVPPLAAAGAEALLAAFRGRLDALAAERAAVVDRADYEPDPARPSLPQLRATLRGMEEGLHGLLQALEAGAPLMAIERAEIDVVRAADDDLGRPTVMRLALTVRGVLLPVEAEPRGAAPGEAR